MSLSNPLHCAEIFPTGDGGEGEGGGGGEKKGRLLVFASAAFMVYSSF